MATSNDQGAVSEPPEIDEKVIGDILTQMSERVETMVFDARRLETERDSLLQTLYMLQSEETCCQIKQEELEKLLGTTDALITQCLALKIDIGSEQDVGQEEALHAANNFMDGLVIAMKSDPTTARARCEAYLHTARGASQEEDGAVIKFRSILVECSSNDRLKLVRRLRGMLNYIDSRLGEPEEL